MSIHKVNKVLVATSIPQGEVFLKHEHGVFCFAQSSQRCKGAKGEYFNLKPLNN